MKLSELISSIGIDYNGHDADVRGLAYDSRFVESGFLFTAVPGERFDGHDFIGEAVERGAVAIIAQEKQADIDERIAQIIVDDARAALAGLANKFYGYPSERLKLVGVTGTNGKTTTAYMLESIFRQAGFKTGLIGTIEYRINGVGCDADRTTPESLDLQRLLAEMVDKGVEVAFIEVSSHSLFLKRIDGCRFCGRIFLNLSRDHLDFHGDLEAYFQAKAGLFADSFGSGLRLVNNEDPYGRRIAADLGKKATTFGISAADYRAVDVDLSVSGTSFTLAGPAGKEVRIASRLLGAFNLANLTASAAAAIEMGVDKVDVAAGLLALDHVPGRFEAVAGGQDFQVLIDYAHTPDGLEKVLTAARNLAGAHRLIAVFGCGGDRDRGKRPQMGAIAATLSDLAIVTSDNPRSEEPQAIIDEILRGFDDNQNNIPKVELDRAKAIHIAISEAEAGDVVVIAGKGHEDYQILGNEVVPFDDRLVAKEALEEILSGTN